MLEIPTNKQRLLLYIYKNSNVCSSVCLLNPIMISYDSSLEGFVPNVVCGNSVEPYEMSLAALGFQFCVNWGDIYRESLVSGPSWVPKQVNNIFMFIHTIDENVSRRLVNRFFYGLEF